MAEKTVQKNKPAKATSGKTVAKATTKPVAKEQAPKQLVKAYARNLRISPRKMRLVTSLVQDMRVADALVQLQFTNKKAAAMVTKLLQSAVANAENNFSLNRDGLFIKSITTDMGQVLKRTFPRARGSAFIIRRKMAHVNLILEERAVKTKKSKNKVAKTGTKTKSVKIADSASGKAENAASKLAKGPKVKEVHNENQSDSVDIKTEPQNLQK